MTKADPTANPASDVTVATATTVEARDAAGAATGVRQAPALPATAEAAARLIAQKTALPAGTDADIARAGAALVLARAGAGLAAQSAKPEKIAASLTKVESLAGLAGGIVAPWLGLRALGAPRGAQIGVSEADLADPVTAALLEASGYVATTDPDATLRGVFTAAKPQAGIAEPLARDPDTLLAASRLVDLGCSIAATLTVANATGTLFTVDLTNLGAATTAAEAIQLIDAKAPSRTVAAGARIGPIAYNTVEAAELNRFATAVFSSYRVRRVEIPNAQAHPTDLVESAALASVLPPVPDYQPHFHPEIVAKGILSEVQLESVIYAGQAHARYLPVHPDNELSVPPRQGFLVGHGTGVGKGRIAAGIVADNWAQGRRRHIWFSASARLIEDARRDWVALGGRAEDVIDIRELAHDTPFPPFSGIVFATYASLRAITENGTRLKQLTDWFGQGEDGVVLFDEAQNLRNAKGGRTGSDISHQGEAALELQNALPNARITYLSATSASDIASLGFAVRLGLWGKTTAFPTAARFFSAMEKGGTNALEMVARDLKSMGLYQAANLSFEGVRFERMHRTLSPTERDAQDRLAEIWLAVNDGLKRAMTHTGARRIPLTARGKVHKAGSIHFMMARARFFQALLATLNTPQVIEAMHDDLAKGHSPIVQMTNTFAANADRTIDEAVEAGQEIDEVEATPRDILLQYLRNSFPTVKMQTVKRGRKMYAEMVTDSQGNPVECAKAAAIRDQLIANAEAVDVPESPLEQILRAFGPETVAEITGRRRRLVPSVQGDQTLEDRTPEDTTADLKAYMDDTKRVLVFSAAGATGATYSAQRTARNQRLRRHYVLQPGWRADLALQSMGRSHRSNQAQAPEYILPSTDLWANQRQISAVARGMRDLGALTRGLRQAASQDFFTQDDNLEDDLGEAAWENFVHSIAKGDVPGLSIGEFEREAGISLRTRMGALTRPLPPLKRFLNAMSAMRCDSQTLFGQHYRTELERLKVEAVENGTLDRGIETITPDSLVKLEDNVIYRDPRTGGETRLLKMLRIDELEPMAYDDARKRAMARGNTRVVKSLMTGRIAILSFPRFVKGRAPQADDKVEVIMPTGTRLRTREEILQERFTQVDTLMAEHIWNAELKQRGDEEERDFWVISGTMLPIWDKLPRDRSTVYRMETDEGEQVIGRVVSESFVDQLITRCDALSSGGLGHDEVDATILKGGVVTLANGWVVQGRVNTYSGKTTLTLSMPREDEAPYARMVQAAALTQSLGPLTTLAYYRLPLSDAERTRALGHILAEAPAVGAAAL